MHYIIAILMIICSFTVYGGRAELHKAVTETHIRVLNYTDARKELFGKLHYYNGIVTDVYCQEDYNASHGVGPGKIPSSQYLNCEHTWPQSKFVGPESEKMKTDLHHLFPSNSRANSVRSNNPFGEITNAPNVCNISAIGKISGTQLLGFEPPPEHRGNVARAMFYFSIRYDLPIDPVQERFFRQWNEEDEPDEEEIARNNLIKSIQGNSNPFIENFNVVNSIIDF